MSHLLINSELHLDLILELDVTVGGVGPTVPVAAARPC